MYAHRHKHADAANRAQEIQNRGDQERDETQSLLRAAIEGGMKVECPTCSEPFLLSRYRTIYCSRICAQKRKLKPDAAIQINSIHRWLASTNTKSGACEFCGRADKPTQWAKKAESAYTRSIKDYHELCLSCHRRYDQPNHCKRGHEFNTANTHVDKLGKKHCRPCQRVRQLERNRRASARLRGMTYEAYIANHARV